MRKSYLQGDRVALMSAVKRGESVREAAGRLGIGVSTAYQWVREATGPHEESAGPVSATFIELMSAGVPSAALVVRIGGAEVEVRPGFDPALLRAVVSALAESA